MLGFLFLVVAIALCLLVANLRRSVLGQQMLAVRANERAAAATGINVARVKITAYAHLLVHRRYGGVDVRLQLRIGESPPGSGS